MKKLIILFILTFSLSASVKSQDTLTYKGYTYGDLKHSRNMMIAGASMFIGGMVATTVMDDFSKNPSWQRTAAGIGFSAVGLVLIVTNIKFQVAKNKIDTRNIEAGIGKNGVGVNINF